MCGVTINRKHPSANSGDTINSYHILVLSDGFFGLSNIQWVCISNSLKQVCRVMATKNQRGMAMGRVVRKIWNRL